MEAAQLQQVADALADRLLPILLTDSRVVVRAPQEYEPEFIVRHLLRRELGDEGQVVLRASSFDPEELQAAMADGRRVVMITRSLDTADELEEAGVTHPIVVIVDDTLTHGMHHSLVICPCVLALTREDLVKLAPEGEMPSFEWARRMLGLTAGVPGLVAEHLATGCDEHSVPESVEQWARRIVASTAEQPLLRAMLVLRVLGEEALTDIAHGLLGRPVSEAELTAVRRAPWIYSGDEGWLAAASLVTEAAQRVMAADSPRQTRDFRNRLADVIVDSQSHVGLEPLSMLSELKAWPQLNRCLTTHMPFLMHFSEGGLLRMVEKWPQDIPGRWPMIDAAVAGVRLRQAPLDPHDGDSTWLMYATWLEATEAAPGSVLAQVKEVWRDLVVLDRRHEEGRVVQSVARFSSQLFPLVRRCVQGDCCSPNDLSLLATSLCAAMDTCLAHGDMATASQAAELSRRALAALVPIYPAMDGLDFSVRSRNALLAAKGGLSAGAVESLRTESRLDHLDQSAGRALALARDFGAVNGLTPDQVGDTAAVDFWLPFSGIEAEIKLLRIALISGAETAVRWGRATVDAADWRGTARWEWWAPAFTLAQLQVNVGEVARAEQEVAERPLPPLLRQLLQASIELAQGQVSSALVAARRVADTPGVPSRWRLLAQGVILACLDPASFESELLLASMEWGKLLGAVVLFPDATKRLLLPRLEADLRSLPGLQPDGPTALGPRLKLTPRQLEMLRLMAQGLSQPEIADHLVVGLETVRSTVKDAYKRLGVHDRQSALTVARAHGLLTHR